MQSFRQTEKHKWLPDIFQLIDQIYHEIHKWNYFTTVEYIKNIYDFVAIISGMHHLTHNSLQHGKLILGSTGKKLTLLMSILLPTVHNFSS